jgi:hypothetical protein
MRIGYVDSTKGISLCPMTRSPLQFRSIARNAGISESLFPTILPTTPSSHAQPAAGEAAQPFAVVARPAEGFSGPATNAANYFALIRAR